MASFPTEAQADRLARAVLTKRVALKPGENVTIETYPSSLPWATGFVREARRLGAHPLIHYEDERSYWDAIASGRASEIGNPGDHEWALLEDTDVYVYFWGPENVARRQKLPDKVGEQLFAFNGKWYDVASKHHVRGVRMGIARATEQNARFWGASLPRWRRELMEAGLRDPEKLVPDARKVASALGRKGTLRIRHPNGTDLTLALAERETTSYVGKVTPALQKTRFGMMASVPDANVLVTVDESTAEGTFASNRPTFAGGTPRRGAQWTFRGGRLTSAKFAEGGREFERGFRSAGKGRDSPSFVEIGLEPAIHISPTSEESERGAVTFGVGGNDSLGGKNDVDFLAYVTLAGAEITLDGRTIAAGGRLG